jgi:DNA-binding response OmpR family regulator
MQDTFSILLVDDDPTVIGVLGTILQEFGRLRFATSGQDALRMARQSVPDLILLDIEMPGMSGFDVCAAMKEMPLLMDVPIIFITSHEDDEHEVAGLALGAADFITKPPRAPQVVARVRMHLRMKQLADALRNAAYQDGLTQIANRRQFEETLHREWLRAQRVGSPTALLDDRYRRLQEVQRSLRPPGGRPLPAGRGAGHTAGGAPPGRPGGALRRRRIRGAAARNRQLWRALPGHAPGAGRGGAEVAARRLARGRTCHAVHRRVSLRGHRLVRLRAMPASATRRWPASWPRPIKPCTPPRKPAATRRGF